MDVALVLLRKNGEKRRFPVTRDVTIIGRREDSDLRIPLGEVSRKHCSIVITDDGSLSLQDLGSSNGTYCNGRRIQETNLVAGDTVRIGSLHFVVQIDGQPELTDLKPAAEPVVQPGAMMPAADALNPTAASEVGDATLDPSGVVPPSQQP